MKWIWRLILLFVAAIILWVDLPAPLQSQINSIVFRGAIQKQFDLKLGLDLKGGSHLVFEADTTRVKPEDLTDALNSARNIIERRVNFFGVSEPVIQTVKSGKIHRITVDLAGVTDVKSAVGLIGKTAELRFREVASESAQIATSTPLPLQFKDTELTGREIKKAIVSFNTENGTPQVTLEFSKKGADLFAVITKRNVGKVVGIFIDQELLSAPVVQQAILEGNAVITGQFTIHEAKELAIAINSGALPLPIRLVEERRIGPSLGKVEVQKSVFAGAVGLIMVILFMVLYYRKLGGIAALALLIYGAITLAIFKLIPIVLTLPGVAGFILSIGMAVDSNILIFERIKEEMREGKPFDIAVRLGFGRAIDAIKDANLTTILVAFILFNPLNWEFLPQFGLVRGFALTLAIGVAASLFTGVIITRRLINSFYRHD